ncbi:MAG: hypothetical protein HRF50_09770 [Phycisphaerae bacterium]
MILRLAVGLVVFSLIGAALVGTSSRRGQSPAPAADTQPSPPPSNRTISGPLDLIPADSLAVWKGLPIADERRVPATSPSGSTVVELFRRLVGANLDARTKLTLRIFEMISLARDYPFAFACVDASARSKRPDGGGTHADKLKLIFVAQTAGESRPLLNIIAKAIKELTDAGPAKLERLSTRGYEYQELTDSRVPDWCRVCWGDLGEYFVLTLGEDVWPLVASVAGGEHPSVGSDEWVKRMRAARPDEPLVEIIVAASRVREQLDPFVKHRATAFFRAWHADRLDRIYWAIGFEGDALYSQASFLEGEHTTQRLLADASYAEPRFAQTIPEGSHYAVFHVPAADVITRIVASYWATQSPDERQRAAELWEKVQRDNGFDAQRDVLDHLGETIILHNFPQHPLRLPMMFTGLYEIRPDGATVSATLERLCQAWLAALQHLADQMEDPPPSVLRRDDDGIWYLQLGPVAGVAWTFTDRYIITSWSPAALREYLHRVGDAVGKR